MRIVDIYIATYLVGYLFFFTCVQFGLEKFDNIFYLWNNVSYGSILSWVCLYVVGSAEVKKKAKPLIAFSAVMYGWELVSFFTGVDVNNRVAVMVAFLLLLSVITYYVVRAFKQQKNYL